jgi:thymidylate synthase (FAD)
LASAGRCRGSAEDFLAVQDATWAGLNRCRERDECQEKLIALGLLEKNS